MCLLASSSRASPIVAEVDAVSSISTSLKYTKDQLLSYRPPIDEKAVSLPTSFLLPHLPVCFASLLFYSLSLLPSHNSLPFILAFSPSSPPSSSCVQGDQNAFLELLGPIHRNAADLKTEAPRKV